MSLKLFRMAVTSATRAANKRPASPSVALSPTRHRSSLTNVPTTPFDSSPKKVKYQNGEKVSEKPKKAYIALGSNMGDRVAMIEQACKEMSSRGVKVTRTSSLWETEPMYVLDQERFVNGACEVGQNSLHCYSASLSWCPCFISCLAPEFVKPRLTPTG